MINKSIWYDTKKVLEGKIYLTFITGEDKNYSELELKKVENTIEIKTFNCEEDDILELKEDKEDNFIMLYDLIECYKKDFDKCMIKFI